MHAVQTLILCSNDHLHFYIQQPRSDQHAQQKALSGDQVNFKPTISTTTISITHQDHHIPSFTPSVSPLLPPQPSQPLSPSSKTTTQYPAIQFNLITSFGLLFRIGDLRDDNFILGTQVSFKIYAMQKYCQLLLFSSKDALTKVTIVSALTAGNQFRFTKLTIVFHSHIKLNLLSEK